MLQAQTQNTALALGGAQNIAMMTQNGLSALAIGANNNQALQAMSAQANLGKF
jgi:ethanolamine ammonia-lyase small subunit